MSQKNMPLLFINLVKKLKKVILIVQGFKLAFTTFSTTITIESFTTVRLHVEIDIDSDLRFLNRKKNLIQAYS